MTTIACDGRTMCGDGMVTCQGTTLSLSDVKVQRLSDGSLCGCCGSNHDSLEVMAWLEGERPDKPEVDRDFGALVLLPSGTMLWYCGNLAAQHVEGPMAIGSGMDFAIGAMAHGATPEEAVAIAARYNPHTGGTFTVLQLED